MNSKTFFFIVILIFGMFTAFSQDHDPELIKLAKEKMPPSLGDFNFLDNYTRFKGSGIKHELTDLAEDGFHAVFEKTKSKGVDKTVLFFASIGAISNEADRENCTIIGMEVTFKSKKDCDKYLNSIGKPTVDDELLWKFFVKEEDPCTSVIVIRDNDKTVRIFVTEGCGQG